MSCAQYVDFIIRHGPRAGEHVKIKCGKCVLCRIDRRREWTQRLQWQWQSDNYQGHFVTLTYRDEYLGDNNLEYEDVQKFMKRLRKRSGAKLKYYAAGEYGEQTLRKHWHIVIFGNVSRMHILKSWPFGGCDVKPIVRNRLRYVLKYLDKEDYFSEECFARKFGKKTPPCHHMSNGLGADYINAHIDEFQDGYITVAAPNGHKKVIACPRYYREKYGLPSPPVQIDPVKARQIEEFRKGGINYVTAYGLVYGAYAHHISARQGTDYATGSAERYKSRYGFRRYYALCNCVSDDIEWIQDA